MSPDAGASSAREVVTAFAQLGLTGFGGPIAHVGHFHREFVQRRRWLDDAEFANLVALCQSLPGPASSQLGFAIGLRRAGWPGALGAFVAFTLPSALLLLALAAGASWMDRGVGPMLSHGLKLVAVAIVAHGVLQLARRLTPDARRGAIAVVGLAAMVFVGSAWMQVAVIAAGALVGVVLLRDAPPLAGRSGPASVSRRAAWVALIAFGVGTGAAVAWASADPGIASVFAAFWRAGSLVFGGGHVVLPLLEESLVGSGWITPERFLTAYGAAQAIPGPMFSVAAFFGADAAVGVPPAVGALVATLAVFAPGFLLFVAVLPAWDRFATSAGASRAVAGIGAAVVGLLGAAFVDPVLSSGITGVTDAVIAATGFALLVRDRATPWVVAWCVAAAALAGLIGI
ncbi:MAG: chromate efflux transporter [Gemmatimonadaceae bacterium]